MLNIEKIQAANHILLRVDSDSFANASAIYSYILTLHKKVSLSSFEEIDARLSFLPWFLKLKKQEPSSADYVLDIHKDVLVYVEFFQNNAIKINKKMATAMYAGLLLRYDNFSSAESDGIVFATASQLIAFGAEHNIVHKNIVRSRALSYFRLEAILYKNMLLRSNAKEAELLVSDEDLKSSGASMKDAIKIMQEVLHLVHVKKVVLKKSDENMKIIKTIEEIKFEK